MPTHKLLQAKKARFLNSFRELASISAAARACKMAREDHYRWMREDPEYVTAFEEAETIAAKALEDEAIRRAHMGIDEPVVYQGRLSYPLGEDGKEDRSGPPLALRKYSDTLLIFLMKGAMPEKYRENIAVEHSGQVDFVGRLSAGRERISSAPMPAQLTTSEPIEAQVSTE